VEALESFALLARRMARIAILCTATAAVREGAERWGVSSRKPAAGAGIIRA